jgi:hypothetical protein
MPSEAFVSVLSARRAEYNAQFLAVRRATPELDEEAFKSFLMSSVEPLIDAVAALDRSALLAVTDTAYAVGLELLSQRLAGPRAASPALDNGFQRLFPRLARFIAPAPELVLPRLCNALHQLAAMPGARPDDWCAALGRLAPSIESTDVLLGVGQVAAWLAGLSQYRAGALALCRSLPAPSIAALLGIEPAALGAALTRLEQDPWFVPSSPELGFRVVGNVGSFRGFGGAFLMPPRVSRVGQELFVSSGEDAWLLALDAFGCTLHRVRPEELTEARSDVGTAGVVVEPTRVSAFGVVLPLRDTGIPRSVAGNATTLLLTTAHSYAITVVALVGTP